MRTIGRLVICCFLTIAPAALAQVKVSAAKEYRLGEKIAFTIGEFPYKSPAFLVDIDGAGAIDYVVKGTDVYVWAKPGTYVVRVIATSFEDKKQEFVKHSFKVVANGVGPTPPGPDPGPGPDPAPPVVPKSVRVLVTFDPTKALAVGHNLVVRGKAFRDYTKTRGPVTEDDPLGPVRIWPTGADVSESKAEWRSLYNRPRTSSPWLVVEADGKVVFEGPLPADTKTTIDQIEKVAPSKVAKTSSSTSSSLTLLRKAG